MRGQRLLIEFNGQPSVALGKLYQDLVQQGHCKLTYVSVCRRIRNGWEAVDALLTPETKRGRAKGCTNV